MAAGKTDSVLFAMAANRRGMDLDEEFRQRSQELQQLLQGQYACNRPNATYRTRKPASAWITRDWMFAALIRAGCRFCPGNVTTCFMDGCEQGDCYGSCRRVGMIATGWYCTE